MAHKTPKLLIVNGRHHAADAPTPNAEMIDCLRQRAEVVDVAGVEDAAAALRADGFTAVFADADDFLPLERALLSQQANLILNTIGEGVCIVDGDGRCAWMNKKMQAWPPAVHEKIRRSCKDAFDFFTRDDLPPAPPTGRTRRFTLNIDDARYLEMIASPVTAPGGQVLQVAAVVWDATPTRRMQQKMDAIDRAGSELVRLEADAMRSMNVGQRLKVLEDKIVSIARDLMHFDHFAVRLLDRKSKKLEAVINGGLPAEAMDVELFAAPEGNGISGYVAATGRSYICADTERDPRYIQGLDRARSALTVPLQLHDRVIGVLNIESEQRAAFTEDDRQFAEIFARYVAIALNILDLMVVERVDTSHKVADDVTAEVAGPLNDIALDANELLEALPDREDLRVRVAAILENVAGIRGSLKQAAAGPNTVLGAKCLTDECDPVLEGASVLVVDDEPNIRQTVADVLRKYHATVTVATSGADAIERLDAAGAFDLVLSDIKMPDKTGYDVFAAARRAAAPPPVILMTGFGYDPNHCIVRASQEGLAAVLFKPFKVEQLLTEVRKAMATAETPA